VSTFQYQGVVKRRQNALRAGGKIGAIDLRDLHCAIPKKARTEAGLCQEAKAVFPCLGQQGQLSSRLSNVRPVASPATYRG
jgi:hypothetical protein